MTIVERLIFIGIMVSFITLSVGSALGESLTYDEIVHSEEGRNHLVNHTFAVDTNNPPLVREIEMLPVVLGGDMNLLPARLVTIFLAAMLLISVFFSAKKIFRPASCIILSVFVGV